MLCPYLYVWRVTTTSGESIDQIDGSGVERSLSPYVLRGEYPLLTLGGIQRAEWIPTVGGLPHLSLDLTQDQKLVIFRRALRGVTDVVPYYSYCLGTYGENGTVSLTVVSPPSQTFEGAVEEFTEPQFTTAYERFLGTR